MDLHLARLLGLDPQRVPDIDALVAALRAPEEDGAACVVGHTNTIPDIIARLGADASTIHIDEADFASLFVVSGIESADTRVLRLTYGGPP